jgi:hypothetical protein
MDRTVREHIEELERKLNLLSAQLMDENNRLKRNQFESELRAVELALAHYRTALELESKLRAGKLGHKEATGE